MEGLTGRARRGAVFGLVLAALIPAALASDRRAPPWAAEGNWFAVQVVSAGAPVPGAEVFIGIHSAGRTDGAGLYRHLYATRPEQILQVAVRKPGYLEWKGNVRVRPGERVGVELVPESAHRLILGAVTERFGVLAGIVGMEVLVDGEVQGRTGPDGRLLFARETPGTVEVEIRHPRGLAPPWRSPVALQGERRIRRFFYPMEPEVVQVGVFQFRANGYQEEDLDRARREIRDAMAEALSGMTGFRIVPDEELRKSLEYLGMDAARLAERGWEGTDLRQGLDVVLVGSVGRHEEFVAEVVARDPAGGEVLRVLGRARDRGGFTAAGQDLASAVRDRFPFRAWVLDVSGPELALQAGPETGWDPDPGEPVALRSFVEDSEGRRVAEMPIGSARIRGAEDGGIRARVERLDGRNTVVPGDLAVRRLPVPPGAEGPIHWKLIARSGEGHGRQPLEGVNIYLDGYWVGRTDGNGRADLHLPEAGSFRLDLYRHGYGPARREIVAPREGEEADFFLPQHLSELRIESVPAGAAVWLDGEPLGLTPLGGDLRVTLGDHDLLLEGGREYRVYRGPVRVERSVEEFTGDRALHLEWNFLAAAAREAAAGRFDAAASLYRRVPPDHSDSVEARRRLAFLLLRQESEPQAALGEFLALLGEEEAASAETVQVEILAGIGEAYCQLGLRLEGSDPPSAETRYLQALFYLQRVLWLLENLPLESSEPVFHAASYHRAVALQKLYGLTGSPDFRRQADGAWREYFDFRPLTMEDSPDFRKAREAGRRFWSELRGDQP